MCQQGGGGKVERLQDGDDVTRQDVESERCLRIAAPGAALIGIHHYLVCYPFRAPECIKLNAAIFRFTLVLSDLNVFT